MTQKCLFDYNAEELIRNKDIVQFRLTELEIEFKKQEAELLLNTDFKELGLTNEKQRTAYVQDASSNDRFELDQIRFEYKQQEDDLEILNDLIKLRLQEVKH